MLISLSIDYLEQGVRQQAGFLFSFLKNHNLSLFIYFFRFAVENYSLMLSVNNISIHFTGDDILKDISFVVGRKEIVGLVGKNGSGKTTLLNILAGQMVPQSGEVIVGTDHTVGYLKQDVSINSSGIVFEEALSAFDHLLLTEKKIKELSLQISSRTDHHSKEYLNLINKYTQLNEAFQLHGGATFKAQTEKILKGLGFQKNDFDRPLSSFSKGWQVRAELAKILLSEPSILLLDEPTNHLDIESIQWFETYITNYKGAVILVSHDRTFLDTVTNRTIEISNTKIYDYKVPYSQFISLREERIELQQAALNNQQKEIKDIERFIERFRYKDSKARQVQSRVKYLEKLDRIEVEDMDTSGIFFRFPPAPRSGKVVIEAKNLHKNYGSGNVLENLNFLIGRQEKIAFVGRNGEGKSTLSKIIAGELDYDGTCNIGINTHLGYLPQDHEELLDYQKTVFQTIDDIAAGEIRKKIRDLLGAFMFRGDDIDKKVSVLSGGEKSRLSIAKLLLQPHNLLVLDEPTNHLDLQSKDILKNALLHYDGTLIIVSHDRDFLQGLTDKVFEFKNKNIKEYIGDVFDFLESRKIENFNELEGPFSAKKGQEKKTSQKKIDYHQKKELEKQLRKLHKEIEMSELKIDQLENEIDTINAALSNPQEEFDNDIYKGKVNRLNQLNTLLQKEMEIWETQQKKAEEANNEIQRIIYKQEN